MVPEHTYIAQWGIVLAVARRFHFVEVVLVQLSDETRHVAVFEVFREYRAGEFLALQLFAIVSIRKSGTQVSARVRKPPGLKSHLNHDKGVAVLSPSSYILMGWVFEHSTSRRVSDACCRWRESRIRGEVAQSWLPKEFPDLHPQHGVSLLI